MLAWRICRSRFAATAWNGEGARLYGGRWNHIGTPIVYTSTSRALAALEVLVHTDPGLAPTDFVMIPAEIPDTLIRQVEVATLPIDWDQLPAGDETRSFGSEWAARLDSVALAVPSVVVHYERNLMINPRHPDFSRVELGAPEPFSFDPRLLPTSDRPH
jgi:RES domain-containing protein